MTKLDIQICLTVPMIPLQIGGNVTADFAQFCSLLMSPDMPASALSKLNPWLR